MNKKPTVCVIGSINMDLTVRTEKMPAKGETVLGTGFAEYPGGKGANQAVSAARLGANVHMIGAVGSDAFGEQLLSHLASENINVKGITVFPEESTGIATIILSEKDNRIIVAPGTNSLVSPNLIEKHKEKIKNSDLVLMQLEISLETVEYALELANDYNVPVILNPAPYQRLSQEILSRLTYITPNEIEVKEMGEDQDINSIMRKLIITKGEDGIQFYSNNNVQHVDGYAVDVKDTTGAGDTFNGALAMQLANGATIEYAVSFANAAAAISVTKVGAQGGMPTKEEVEQFLAGRMNTD